MADDPPLPLQPLPDWMSYSLITDDAGIKGYTIVTLPLTYYGPSIPLGTDGLWTYGGLSSPAEETQPPTTETEPEQVTVTRLAPTTVTLEPTTETVITPSTVTVIVPPNVTSGSVPPPPLPSTSSPSPSDTRSAETVSLPSTSESDTFSATSESGISGGTTTNTSESPPSTGTASISEGTGSLSTSPVTPTSTERPSATRHVSTADSSSAPTVSASHAYLGLPPDAFLGVILGILLALIVFACCLICCIRHRRRQRRRRLHALPPPTSEPNSRLLAGDRDRTNDEIAYPYRDREYRRSQIAVMRARGELDEDESVRLQSPSVRTASLRIPEDGDLGVAYGVGERYAAAGVSASPHYAFARARDYDEASHMRSIGGSTMPTITPATAAAAAAATTVPGGARKDTQSTNDSSAIHLYAGDHTDIPEQLFYLPVSEADPHPSNSPVASSADMHYPSGVPPLKSGSSDAITRTKNLEEVPRSAIAYPESPISDTAEDARLMSSPENSTVMVMGDVGRSHGNQWLQDHLEKNPRASQQPPILQRVFNRVIGNRLSQSAGYSNIPAGPIISPPSPEDRYYDNPRGASQSSLGLTGHQGPIMASQPRDETRRWGFLPYRWSLGDGGKKPSGEGSQDIQDSALGRLEEGSGIRIVGPSSGQSGPSALPFVPAMQEVNRAGTPSSLTMLAPTRPPPVAGTMSSDNRFSTVSGQSTIFYDARSSPSLESGRERGPSPTGIYDIPPPQPFSSLRSAHSAQSLPSISTAPLFPPGLYPEYDEEDETLDDPPPMPTRDVRQARSLNTIFSVGSAETYDTINPPIAIGSAFLQDEQVRLRPSSARVVPSEAVEGDLSALARSFHDADDDDLEEEPPMPASQWRTLSSYQQVDNDDHDDEAVIDSFGIRRSFNPRQSIDVGDRDSWRLALGQSARLLATDDQGSYHSLTEVPATVDADSHRSRGSSSQTNGSHSRDIHSLRASEGGNTGGSNNSGQTRSVSEHGHLQPMTVAQTRESSRLGQISLTAFGEAAEAANVRSRSPDSSIETPSPRAGTFWWRNRDQASPQPPSTPPLQPLSSVRLVGSTSPSPPLSAPTGWPSQPEMKDYEDPPQPRWRTHPRLRDLSRSVTSTSHTHDADTTMTEATTLEDTSEMPFSDVEHILEQPPPLRNPELVISGEAKEDTSSVPPSPTAAIQAWLTTPRWQRY